MVRYLCTFNWTAKIEANSEREAGKRAYAMLRSRIELKKVKPKDFTCRPE